MRSKKDRILKELLGNLADLIHEAMKGKTDLTRHVQERLQADGCVILTYRPMAGRVELALATERDEPHILFVAAPAERVKQKAASIN